MKKRIVKTIISMCLGVAVACTAMPYSAEAAPVSGAISKMFQDPSTFNKDESITGVLAGANMSMLQTVVPVDEQEALIPVEVQENNTLGVDYKNMAVAHVNDCVKVRSAPSEEGEVLGKLYNEGVGEVLGVEGDWVHIKSGSVDGYVSADYVSVGNKEDVEAAAKYLASVNADALKIRADMSTESAVLDVARNGEKLVVSEETSNAEWVKVESEKSTDAYVSSEYVDINVDFTYAESKEEEAARLEQERAQMGVDVANYALQFVGNPYVWGGTSLTRGADCSGFVMSVYAHFGVGLPHSSAADRGVGRKVEPSQMRAGDLVCYRGHVALCIGGGRIVHAASRRSGIITSSAYYRKIVAVRRIF